MTDRQPIESIRQVREDGGDFKARSLAKIDAAMRYASEEAHWIQEEAHKLQKEAYRFAHNKPPRCVLWESGMLHWWRLRPAIVEKWGMGKCGG